jgi:hypothetical protein
MSVSLKNLVTVISKGGEYKHPPNKLTRESETPKEQIHFRNERRCRMPASFSVSSSFAENVFEKVSRFCYASQLSSQISDWTFGITDIPTLIEPSFCNSLGHT